MQQNFNSIASTYQQAAFIEQEIGARLLQRLTQLNIQPQRILDLGCGTGYFCQELHRLFPAAQIIGIDIAHNMLQFGARSNNINYINCNAEFLPFAARSFDLVFANCSVMYIPNFISLSQELQRVLKPQAVFLFSALSPTSQNISLPDNWLTWQYYGDILLQTKFTNPVVDVEEIVFNYPNLDLFLTDAKNSGLPIDDTSFTQHLTTEFNASIDVIYGICWVSEFSKQLIDAKGQHIPLEAIKYL